MSILFLCENIITYIWMIYKKITKLIKINAKIKLRKGDKHKYVKTSKTNTCNVPNINHNVHTNINK